jgi:hypothetical protein
LDEPLMPGAAGGFRSDADAYYDLDAGMFDATMASLLGIPRPTGPSSFGYADMGLLSGDHTSSALEANDGVLYLEVEPAAVPEPPQALLAAAGLLAAYLTRFKPRSPSS